MPPRRPTRDNSNRKRVKAAKVRGESWGVVYADTGRKVPGTFDYGEGNAARRQAQEDARIINERG